MPYADLPRNLRMHYYDDYLGDPWRADEVETVVMHHGQGKNGLMLYGWVPVLAPDYRVIRIDGRGFGLSSVPEPGFPWSLETFVQDTMALMDHLGIEKAHYIGETIGGTMGMHFAHAHPERLLTLTTCTSPFNFVGSKIYVDYYNIVKEKGTEAWARSNGDVRLDSATSDPRHREWYLTQMGKTDANVVMETLAYLGTVNLEPILPQITVPSLAIVGGDSGWYRERSERMVSMMQNATLKVLPGVGGFAQHSAPVECANAWREWVAGVKVQRPSS
jgi:pimeloyl-ACP methyl ester carboxylesterase